MNQSLKQLKQLKTAPDSFGWSDFPLLMLSSQHHESDVDDDSAWGHFHDTSSDVTSLWRAPLQTAGFSSRNEVLSTIPEENCEKVISRKKLLPMKDVSFRANKASQRDGIKQMSSDPSRKRLPNAFQRTLKTKTSKRVGRRVLQSRNSLLSPSD